MVYALRIRLNKRSDNASTKVVLEVGSSEKFNLVALDEEFAPFYEMFPEDRLSVSDRNMVVDPRYLVMDIDSQEYRPTEISLQRLAMTLLENEQVEVHFESDSHAYDTVDEMHQATFNWLDLAETASPVADTTTQAPEAQTEHRFDVNNIGTLLGYSQNTFYRGMNSYHSYPHTGYNTPDTADPVCRVGVELEMFGRNQEAYRDIVNTRTNWFMCERDGSLYGDYPVEVKTIPINLSDAIRKEFWEPAMDWFKAKAKSKSNSSSGLHLHFGVEAFGSDDAQRRLTIGKLIFFYCGFVKQDNELNRINITVNGRSACYGGYTYDSILNNTRTVVSQFYLKYFKGIAPVGTDADAEKTIADEMFDSNANSRWDINNQHVRDYKTVEFRLPKGIISSTRLAALVGYYYTMIDYVKTHHIWEYNKADFIEALRRNPNVAYYIQGDEEV